VTKTAVARPPAHPPITVPVRGASPAAAPAAVTASAGTVASTIGLLVVLPALVLLARWSALPTSDYLSRHLSLLHASPQAQRTLGNVVFIPVGALVVVFFRLTLGIRVLGPFRSVLLAFAFVATGIPVGVAFLVATVVVLVLVRPSLKSLALPYFGRVSVMLCAVTALIVAGTLVGTWVGSASVRGLANFPVVVVCLIGEAVARTIRREGVTSGIWRAGTTTLIAILVTLLASIHTMRSSLLAHPELVLLETAGIVLVSRYAPWRLLQRWNPPFRRSHA
jgi:hypothetical protein